MKPDIVICVGYPPEQLDIFREHFTVHYAPTAEELERVLAASGQIIRGAVTTGSYGLSAASMEKMPKLELVAIRGVGTENVDLEAARRLGVSVSNCPGINFFAVSEHAVALLLSVVRRIPADDVGIRNRQWQVLKQGPMRNLIYRKRLGILGLGAIGKSIADRVQGFEMTIGYHNRTPRTDVPYRYFSSLLELARESDILMISTPGGIGTKSLVTAEVLEALGPSGYVVNTGRGSVIDQTALIAALRAGRIAGAALDVVDGEPEMPEALLKLPNVVLTPHIGGNAPESRYAAIASVVENLVAKFSGQLLKNQLV